MTPMAPRTEQTREPKTGDDEMIATAKGVAGGTTVQLAGGPEYFAYILKSLRQKMPKMRLLRRLNTKARQDHLSEAGQQSPPPPPPPYGERVAVEYLFTRRMGPSICFLGDRPPKSTSYRHLGESNFKNSFEG